MKYINRIICAVLVIVLCASSINFNVFAQEVNNSIDSEEDEVNNLSVIEDNEVVDDEITASEDVIEVFNTDNGEQESDYIASGVCGTNVSWTLDKEYTLTISGDGRMDSTKQTDIRWGGYSSNIKKIIVEEGVRYIGDYCFYNCMNVEDISLPETLTRIDTSAFEDCQSLSKLTLPSSLSSYSSFGFDVFKNTAIVSVGPAGTSTRYDLEYKFDKSIPMEFLHGCNSVKTVIIDARIRTINGGAFYKCINLEKIIIPNSVTTIYEGAFAYSNNVVIYGDNNSYAKTYAENNNITF